MFKQAFLLSLLIHNAFPDCQCGVRTRLGRIFGGKNAQPGQYPWQAFIIKFEDGVFSGCGGSIINNEWILTVAHCLPSSSTLKNGFGDLEMLVRVGRVSNADMMRVLQPWFNYKENDGPRPEMSTLHQHDFLEVDRWVSHKDYNETLADRNGRVSDTRKYFADIALLHVQTPIKFSAITRPVCLEPPNSARNFYPIAELSGWGNTFTYSNGSVHLKGATVSESEDCSWDNINPLRQMCFNSGSPGGCQGDSGSPYVVEKNGRFYQIAIMSIGDEKCSEESGVRIGIRTSYYYNWIKLMAKSGTWCSP